MEEEEEDKVKRFSITTFDNAHYKATEQYVRVVDALFDTATTEIAKAAARGEYNPDKPFSIDDYPKVKAVVKSATKQLASRLTATIETGARKEWLFACEKNDGFLNSIMDTSKLPKEQLKRMQDRNLDALEAFQKRKVDGMNLSQRVWKYVGQYSEQIETALDVGLGEGRSAQELARDVKQNLKEPNRLFRRVRDKRGNLVLSKAAKAYHPGRGVYRSSVKNAQRLTRSEINMAYRESDWQRWQTLDFVVGFEIKRSNWRDSEGNEYPCALCDKLKGRYPKWFKFKGWHPQCRCFAVPILRDYYSEEAGNDRVARLRAALNGTEYKKHVPKDSIADVPDGFKEWVKDHVEAQKNWASTPYFIRDNFKDGKLSEGLKYQSPTKPKIDPVQQQLDALQAEIVAMRQMCYDWGLNTFILDDAIKKRNPNDVIIALWQLKDRVNNAKNDFKIYLADATQAIKDARKYKVDVTDMLEIIATITGDKREWVLTKASCKKALQDLLGKIASAKQSTDPMTDWYSRSDAAKEIIKTKNDTQIETALKITKGVDMTFKEADDLRGNPNYAPKYIPDPNGRYQDRKTKERFSKNPNYKKKFTINCQSCVVAHELRRRGYDVQAVGNTANSIPRVLSHHTELAWLDADGNTPASKQIAWSWDADKKAMIKSMIANFETATKEIGRYHIKWTWDNMRNGHIITCERLADGTLRIYDPQNGREIADFGEYGKNVLHNSLKILRVDNLRFNPLYAGCLKGNKRPKKR